MKQIYDFIANRSNSLCFGYSLGSITWKRTIGGSDNDWAYVIRQTIDGGYIVGGNSMSNNGNVTGNHGDIDGWLVKLDSLGMIQWQKSLGGSGSDEIWSLQQTADGGFVIAGRSTSNDGDLTENKGNSDLWVVKLDALGVIQWQKSLGGSKADGARSVKETSDGGYIIVGETASDDGDVLNINGNVDYWVVKLNNTGSLEWQKTFGGSSADFATGVVIANDGGYVVVGYSGSHNTGDVTGHYGLFDYWVIKLDEIGELLWQKALGGNDTDWAREIIKTYDDGYAVFGTTTSTNGDVIGNDGGADLWLIKLNNVGDIIWQKTFGGTQAEEGYSIQQTSDNGFVLAGYAWSNNGDLTGSVIHGINDFWIVKLSPETTSSTHAPAAPLSIFPNPAQTTITLQIPTTESSLQVTISDLLGRTLSRQNIKNGGQADISILTSGMYLISAASEAGQLYVGKLRKE